MRRKSVEILAAGVVLFVSASPVIAELRFDDGGIHNIDYAIIDYFVVVDNDVSNKPTTMNVLEEAHINLLDSRGDSIINVFAGSMIGEYLSLDNSEGNIYGGSVFLLGATDSSQINVFGIGTVDDLYAESDGTVTIHGSDFAVDGAPVGYVELTGSLSGQLTGTLHNGDPLNTGFYIFGNGKIVLVPEPATVLLLGLGGLGLLRRRSQA